MSQPATDETTNIPIPPANFLFLVESILMQVQMQLGLLNFGGEDDEKPEPDLNLARHSIDMLAMLQDKTKGNLTLEERRLLENGLTEMRFRYVQIADDLKKKNARPPQASTAPPDQPASTDSATKPPEDDRPRIIIPDGGKGSKSV